MPIYAYQCRSCGKEFSTLVRGGDTPECPACAGVDLERRLSLIASPLKSGEDLPPPACGAGMGACGTGGCPAFAGD
ncbi:MAG: zinc ribbon domain-containing protein [Siculibacillus sp.]